MNASRSLIALMLSLGLAACGGRSPTNTIADDGGQKDSSVLVDDSGQPLQLDASPHDSTLINTDGMPPQQDAAVPPGLIPCGTANCDATTQECCLTTGGGSCVAKGGACTGLTATCAGPQDCDTTDPVCCFTFGGGAPRDGGTARGAVCTTDQGCTAQSQRLCRYDADCAGGEKCCGGGTYMGYTVTWCAAATSCGSSNPTAGVVCNGSPCTTPDVCCVTLSGISVTQTCGAATACTGGGVTLACDGPEDCGGGTPVCCGSLQTGAQCAATGSCQSSTTGGVLCHNNDDCPTGTTCKAPPIPNLPHFCQ
jgi:hypothetical protein